MSYAYTKVYARGTDIKDISLSRMLRNLDEKSLESEIWKDIDEFPGLYQVSNLGRIRSLPRAKMDKLGRICVQTGCILSQLSEGANGKYKKVILRKDGHVYNRQVHRIVACAFIDNMYPDIYKYVNHIDGDPSNNSVSNLEWVTAKQNTEHAIRLGLFTPRRYPGMHGYR